MTYDVCNFQNHFKIQSKDGFHFCTSETSISNSDEVVFSDAYPLKELKNSDFEILCGETSWEGEFWISLYDLEQKKTIWIFLTKEFDELKSFDFEKGIIKASDKTGIEINIDATNYLNPVMF